MVNLIWSNSSDRWVLSASSGDKKNLREAWKSCRILRLQSLVNAIIFGTMLSKLSTFYVPKAGRRATFGCGRNLVKFWRHSALSGLGNCKTCIFYCMWRCVGSEEEIEASQKPIKSLRTMHKIVGEWTLFIWLSIKWIFEKKYHS